jgi:hypothetical protein
MVKTLSAVCSAFERFDDDSKIRTMCITPVAGGAFLWQNHDRVIVRIKRQHFCWAEFDAKPAALAPHTKNYHLAARSAFGFGGRFFLNWFLDSWDQDIRHEQPPKDEFYSKRLNKSTFPQ